MYTVKGIYDGANFKFAQPFTIKEPHEVIVTFIEPLAIEQLSKRPFSELRGLLKGRVWMADDFNAPLEELREYME